MGQFKPMVKMMTTEPTVELKLKKGGKVTKKADGGMMMPAGAPSAMPSTMPPRGGAPAAAAPMRPSLAMRRRAMRNMPTGAAPAAPVGPMSSMMKEGGKADMAQDKAMIKKAFKQHDTQEHKGGKGTKLALKKGGKMATGGVVDGQGGYAAGGIIKSEKGNTIMHTSSPDRSPAKTGEVKLGNGGGYKTGGVAKANGGGYKRGGSASKKAYATGGVVDSGRPVAMPQGKKKPSSPVSIDRLSGTFKKGGAVAPGNRNLQNISAKENAPARIAANLMTNEKYGRKMAKGGSSDFDFEQFRKQDSQSAQEQQGEKDWRKAERDENVATRKFMTELPGKAVEAITSLPGKAKELFDKFRGAPGAVTKTKESVTVAPKKRGGAIKR